MSGTESSSYPFTAIVNQERMKLALLLNAVNPLIGGVLIRGASGTAKSTAVRGLIELLPEIDVVAGCPFGCSPGGGSGQCDECNERNHRGEQLPVAKRKRNFVNLPLNATEDRVAGSLDISRALKEGIKALEPGLLAQANRGILYIDEINLLDDQIVDILLDAAAQGINIVEREGVSVSHPARFILIGTMNPEEGELRPQIADRIGLQVEVNGIKDTAERVEVIKRTEAYLQDPSRFAEGYLSRQQELREKIAGAIELLPEITIPDYLYSTIPQLTKRFNISSHWADISTFQCAKTLAALNGRLEVTAGDIVEGAAMALGHRIPYDPFNPEPSLDQRDIRREFDRILEREMEEKKTSMMENRTSSKH